MPATMEEKLSSRRITSADCLLTSVPEMPMAIPVECDGKGCGGRGFDGVGCGGRGSDGVGCGGRGSDGVGCGGRGYDGVGCGGLGCGCGCRCGIKRMVVEFGM